MRLMLFDRCVAKSKLIDGQQWMVQNPGVDPNDLPFGLFGLHGEKEMIPLFDFGDWAEDRCFPENRVDKDYVLQTLGLDRYDKWAIVKKTNARMPAEDSFWVDFDR